jgi:HEAT repeat protein
MNHGLLCCACLLYFNAVDIHGQQQPKIQDAEAKRIRSWLNAREFGTLLEQLESMGSSANLIYIDILRDEEAGSLEITRILNLVAGQKGDRSQFLSFAIRLTNHKEAYVRSGAARLLGNIGTSEDAPVLAPLLTDERSIVQEYAAEALAKIGTAKELHAFDRRLGSKHSADREYPELLGELKKQRDQLKKRLDIERNKK